MSTTATATRTDGTASIEHVLQSLDNQTCPFCDDGSLRPGQYEGDPAVVCDDCDAPLVRV